MDKNIKILLITGIFVTIILLFVNIYLAGVMFILFITLVMSFLIMQDSQGIPEIDVSLSDDAKAVLVTNKGNAKALNIHVALVPANQEFDIPVLLEDATHRISLSTMAEQLKVVTTYENEKGRSFSFSSHLSALEGNSDPLKPMIPVFKWK
jgi:hypothetical protein